MDFFENAIITNIPRASKIYTKHSDGIYCHARPTHGFVYHISGVNRYEYQNGIKFTAEKDMFLYLPKGETYKTFPDGDSTCILINVDTANDLDIPAFGQRFSRSNKLLDNFRKAVNIKFKNEKGCLAELTSVVYKIISLVQNEQDTDYVPNSTLKKIEPAISCICEKYCDADLSITELASLCGMSERYFGRLFCAHFGVYPKQYIVSQRIELARSLLSDSDESVALIAESCGFSNPYYFSRTFRQHVGMSPSEYRKVSARQI